LVWLPSGFFAGVTGEFLRLVFGRAAACFFTVILLKSFARH
jgi:hypothetical protein